MNKLFFSASLAASLAAAQSARADAVDPVLAVVKILLDSPTDPSTFGSGVMVSDADGLPVVATCAHVINGRSNIYVYLPYKSGPDAYVHVEKIKADFPHDVAYLLLDEKKLRYALPVRSDYAGPDGPDNGTAVYGWSGDERVDRVAGLIVGVRQDAVMLLPPRLRPVSSGLSVIELEDPNHTGNIVFGGDSGGPIIVGGQVVGLAAGYEQIAEKSRRRPFAVPFPATMPLPRSADELKDAPGIRGDDVYAKMGAMLTTALSDSGLQGLSFSSSFLPCAARVRPVLGRYHGRADELPESLGTDPLGVTCSGYYDGLRRDKIVLEDAALKETVLHVEAKHERAPASSDSPAKSTSEMMSARANDELKSYAVVDSSVRSLFIGVGKEPQAGKKASPPTKANKLESLALSYRSAAIVAQQHIRDLVTKAAAPPPVPAPSPPAPAPPGRR